jgi:hypothetical protein
MRRLVLARTRRLLELDAILRGRGEPGVLQRSEEELQLLEEQELGPESPDSLTDVERRAWVRRRLVVIPGGVS